MKILDVNSRREFLIEKGKCGRCTTLRGFTFACYRLSPIHPTYFEYQLGPWGFRNAARATVNLLVA